MHPIDRQMLPGVAVVLLLIVAGAAIGFRNIHQLEKDQYWVVHTHVVIDSLDDLLSTIKDAETGQRGYLITGNEDYLKPYQNAATTVDAKVNSFDELTKDNPYQQEHIDRLRTVLKAKLDELAQTIALRKAQGFEASENVVSTNLGKEKMDALRGLIGDMREEEEQLLTDRQTTDDRAYDVAVASVSIVTLLSIGVVIGLAVNVRRRISERLKVAAELHEQQEWFRITLSSIGDAVIASDTRGCVRFLNPVAEALTGWKQAEAQGMALVDIFDIVNEQSRKKVENPTTRVLREGVIVGLANHTVLISRDGTEKPIDDSAAPIRDAKGDLVGVVLVFRDVTEQRNAERALKQADRIKDEFLATLSHELRNPLVPIRNAAQLLKLAELPDADARWSRDVIERQVFIIARLLDDLLDVSRITRGKLELRREIVALSSIVDSAVETSKPLIDTAGVKLHLAVPSEPIFVDADPVRIAQVLSNLLNNASRYTDRGGEIWLTLKSDGKEASISVKDTGIGIEADVLPGIFEMFSQAKPALERSRGGLGIGLALVRGVVELHSGKIQAKSEGSGRGSEFIVTLPTVAAPSPSNNDKSAPDSSQTTREAKCRVLVAEDNADAAESLVRLLRLNGHDVQAAYDGRQAIAEAEKFKPTVALLDIGLPDLTGYDVARHVRSQDWGKEMVLVALTGWGQEEDKRRTREAGFDQHIVKPVDPMLLLKMLESYQKRDGH
jgi:PAS domain S-box-containing protein